MAIRIQCPNCFFEFNVFDSMAGRQGRCPDCDAVIDVPADGSGTLRERRLDPDSAYGRPRDGGFADDGDRFEGRNYRRDDARNDYREIEPEKSGPKFDPRARVEKWQKVASGFRNLAIAYGLILVALALRMVTTMAEILEGKNFDNPNFDTKDLVLSIAEMIFWIFTFLFWGLGRLGCGHCPYVPARKLAKPVGFMAVATTAFIILGAIVTIIGFAIMRNDLQMGAGLVLFGVCGGSIFGCGAFILEILAFFTQISMSKGLNSPGLKNLSQSFLIALVITLVLGFVGFCVMVGIVSSEMQKNMPQNNPNPQKNPWQKKDVKKMDDINVDDDNVNNPNNPNNPNQPPQMNPETQKKMMYVMIPFVVITQLTLCLLAIGSFVSGRKAIRRECEKLLGDENERDLVRDY